LSAAIDTTRRIGKAIETTQSFVGVHPSRKIRAGI
jgi:hypothetical protein